MAAPSVGRIPKSVSVAKKLNLESVLVMVSSANNSPHNSTVRDPQIDRICQAAASFCEMPFAAVTVADGNDEVLKSSFGFSSNETWPVGEDCLPGLLIESASVIQVTDTELNDRGFGEAPVINATPVRRIVAQRMFSYEQKVLGTFFLLGNERDKLTPEQLDTVSRLARLVASLLDLNREPMDHELFCALQATLDRGVVITDPNIPDQPITYCNDEFSRITGYQPAEILGKNCRFLQRDDVDKLVVAGLKSDLALGSCRSVILKNYRKNGCAFWNEMFVVIERDQNGRARQYIGMIEDVTDRVDSQQCATLSENVIEGLPFAIFLNDPHMRRYLAVNAVARELIGYSNDELLDMGPADIIPELTGETFLAMVRPILEGSVDQLVRRTVCERSDGAQFPMEAVLRRAVIGDTEAIVSYCSDITHRQRLEDLVNPKGSAFEDVSRVDDRHDRLLRSLRVARSANKEKSRFLAAASHDLRQPLHVIGLALDGLAREDDPHYRNEFSSTIRESVDVMSEMLAALLDVSRFDSGAIEPKISEFPIERLIQRVVANNMATAQSKGLALEFEEMNFAVRSDYSLLERVLDNIVANALRYTTKGGVHISAKQESMSLRISVSDTGIGIPPESTGEIFDEYFQLSNNISSATKGLGLGLSIVKRICNLLAIPIHVKSALGKGSTFSLDLEFALTSDVLANSSLLPDNREEVSVTAPKTVLFVEDNASIAKSTSTLLRKTGAIVEWAPDLAGALSILKAGYEPDVVITDYRLAGANGIQVVKEVRDVAQQAIPALITTGDAGIKELLDELPEQCELVFKPVSFAVLCERISDLLVAR